ncbi:MAG TPA: class I SAM-dependent methyltransferase [Actinocrinis sp.]|nr:class I SAM-dependent methyltransferase [Actinocrinis sp.]
MDLSTLGKIVRERELPVLLALTRGLINPVYRAAFLAAASRYGVLTWLAARPCDLASLAAKLEIRGDPRQLRAWLDIGVRLGELEIRGDGTYALHGRAAKALAAPRHRSSAAALEEVLRFQLPALLEAPGMLRDGRRLALTDQDGPVIARSTRILRPFVEGAVERVLDRAGAVRLLEVGCGSGEYVRHAAALNPRLTALAIDLQADVVIEAAKNVADWGLADRVEVRRADLRTLELEPQFDLITMHNNIYYFAEAERVAALERARALLAPGGRLLLTTACRGGQVGLEVLNLWFELADFGGPLPQAAELAEQLRQAGFADVQARRLTPGEQFYAFTGTESTASIRTPVRPGGH